jgi:hypothetical protein
MGNTTPNNSWRLEVNNPNTSTDWHPLWKLDTDQYSAYEELANSLNKINAPIQVRIVRHAD